MMQPIDKSNVNRRQFSPVVLSPQVRPSGEPDADPLAAGDDTFARRSAAADVAPAVGDALSVRDQLVKRMPWPISTRSG
jgi:hypothetical protein